MSAPPKVNPNGKASPQSLLLPPLRRFILWTVLFLAAGCVIWLIWQSKPTPTPPFRDGTVAPPALPPAETKGLSPKQPPAAPTAKNQLAPFPPAIQEEPGIRLIAMTGGRGNHDIVWILDQTGGENIHPLSIGDSTFDGWRLIEIQVDQETATFEKEGCFHIARMEAASPAVPAEKPLPIPEADRTQTLAARNTSQLETSPRPVVPPGERPLPSKPSDLAGDRVYSEPFRNQTILADSGNVVVLQGVTHAPEIVEIVAGHDRFAIRRDIAESILQLDDLSPDERLDMLESYPGLVKVVPGEDSAKQAVNAERQLAEMLVPPTNTPSVEELDELIDQVIDEPPSAPDLPEM